MWSLQERWHIYFYSYWASFVDQLGHRSAASSLRDPDCGSGHCLEGCWLPRGRGRERGESRAQIWHALLALGSWIVPLCVLNRSVLSSSLGSHGIPSQFTSPLGTSECALTQKEGLFTCTQWRIWRWHHAKSRLGPESNNWYPQEERTQAEQKTTWGWRQRVTCCRPCQGIPRSAGVYQKLSWHLSW